MVTMARHKLRLNFRSNQGFSLAEVMVVTAIVGVVGLGVAAITSNIAQKMEEVSLKTDRNSLQAQLEANFRKSESCKQNIISNSISMAATPSLALNSIKAFNDAGAEVSTIIPGVGQTVNPGSKLQVASMQFTGPASTGSPVLLKDNATSKTYLGALRITFNTPVGQASLRPILVPSILIETNNAGLAQNCSIEKSVDVRETCETSLGLTLDSVSGSCLPTNTQAKRGLCASIGGSQPGMATYWYRPTWQCRLPSSNTNFQCPNTGDVIIGYNQGVPVCQAPSATGVWSAWSACIGGTKTRSCLIGTCPGDTTASCT